MIRQERIETGKYDVGFDGKDVLKMAQVSILSILYGLAVLLITAVVTITVLVFGMVVLD
jgi:hypothetical protein